MIGGHYGFYNLFPFIVEIFMKSQNSTGAGHVCAGSLISYDWVLTAAHCVGRQDLITYYYIGAGRVENSYNSTVHGFLKFRYGQTRKVERVIPHPKFDKIEFLNDIGLIKVKVPFTADDTVSPIKLPLKDEQVDLTQLYKYCYIGGWGTIGPNYMLVFDHRTNKWKYNRDTVRTSKLVYTVLPLISIEQCNRLDVHEMGVCYNVDDTQLCTLYYPGRKSLCRGDSGGPLICGSKQYGIVSWSYGCGTPRMGADVYTRVDKYLDWINAQVNTYGSTKKANTAIIKNLSHDEYDDYYDLRKSGLNESNKVDLAIILILIINYIIIFFIR